MSDIITVTPETIGSAHLTGSIPAGYSAVADRRTGCIIAVTSHGDITEHDDSAAQSAPSSAAEALPALVSGVPSLAADGRIDTVTLTIDGISYRAVVELDDPDICGDREGYRVTLLTGRRDADYTTVVPACVSARLDLEFGTLIRGLVHAHCNHTAAATMPEPAADYAEALEPLRALVRRVELDRAPMAVRQSVTDDMGPAAIRAAADQYKADRAERRAQRDSKRVAAAQDTDSETLQGDGWAILFDSALQRTRLIFADRPADRIVSLVKAHGYSWNYVAHEWRRGLNAKARADALVLMHELAGA